MARCGTVYRQQVETIGGFHAHFSEGEKNEWGEYVRTTPEWNAYFHAAAHVNALMGVHGHGVDVETVRAAIVVAENARGALYYVAKDFYDRVVAPRIEAEEAALKKGNG